MRIKFLAQRRITIGCAFDDRGDLQNGSKRRQRRIANDGPGAQDPLDIFAGSQASGRRCSFHFDGKRRRHSGCQRLRLHCPTPSARQRNKLREGPPPNSRRTCLQVPSCLLVTFAFRTDVGLSDDGQSTNIGQCGGLNLDISTTPKGRLPPPGIGHFADAVERRAVRNRGESGGMR